MAQSEQADVANKVVGEEKPYNVSQYNTAVQRYLVGKVPQVWVHGVITQLNVRDKVAYITLGDFEIGNTRPKATIQAFMWTSELEKYHQRFQELPTPFELKAELKVSVLLKAEFYIPFGKFQPKVLDIDENFTLGELAQARKQILEGLQRDGLLDKNKSLELSSIPLKIGLITAPNSAAFNDFTKTLMASHFSVQIDFHEAKMQGEQTEATLLEALERLKKYRLDVVCIVRGGGAKTDLIYFDSDAICRAIAHYPIPVLTGIGHEIDQSLADLVSYKNLITPTDCANYLVQRLEEAYSEVLELQQNIVGLWEMQCKTQWDSMMGKAESLKHHWRGSSMEAHQILRSGYRGMSVGSVSQLRRAKEVHKRFGTGLLRGSRKMIQVVRLEFEGYMRQVANNWSRWNQVEFQKLQFGFQKVSNGLKRVFVKEQKDIVQNAEGLSRGLPKQLIPVRDKIRSKKRELHSFWSSKLRIEKGRLKGQSQLVHQLDPKRVLERGYSIARNGKGQVVRSVEEVQSGDTIHLETQDGTIKSTVDGMEKNIIV